MTRPLTQSGQPVRIIAHRGFHVREPENSLAAMVSALELGAGGIEVDVRLCSDGTLVCFHDWFLKRLTGASGRVSRTGIQRLLELPLLHPTSNTRRPIATLAEVLSLIEDRVLIVLDLKKESVRASSLEMQIVRHLREAGLCENIVISSFNPWVLKRVRQIAPEFTTALIASTKLSVRLFHPDYCDSLHIHHALLKRKWFQRMVPTFRRLMVWTVDQPTEIETPLPDNVCGLITNRPDRFGCSVRIRRKVTFRSPRREP